MKSHSTKIFMAAVVLVTVLSSCNKTEENKEVYIDSYVNSIFNRAGVPVYAVMHTAYSFTKLTSVTVTGASGVPVKLTDSSSGGYSFYTPVADSSSYTTTVPAAESFTYNTIYDSGETIAKVDAIVAKSLIPPQQLSAVKNTTDIVLSWKPVPNVESYKVRIYSEDSGSTTTKSLIYDSDFLTPKDATSDLSIPFSLTSLSQYLSTNVYFEVSASFSSRTRIHSTQ